MTSWAQQHAATIDFSSKTEPANLTYDPVKKIYTVTGWNAVATGKPAVKVDLLAFYAGIIRTSAATSTPSPALSKATGALAGALARFISISATTGHLEVSADYALLKDFVRTGLTGVAGAGMAYLHMIEEGYTWFAHYEDCVPPRKEKRPDFVFSKPSLAGKAAEYVLVETKGTQDVTQVAIDRAQAAFLKQVVPRSDRQLLGMYSPTHGYGMATAFNSPKPSTGVASEVDFAVAGQAFPAPAATTPVVAPPPAGTQGPSVQLANYQALYRAIGLPFGQLPVGLRDVVSGNLGEIDTPLGLFDLRLVIPRAVATQLASGRLPEPERMERPDLEWRDNDTKLDVRFPDLSVVRMTRKGNGTPRQTDPGRRVYRSRPD